MSNSALSNDNGAAVSQYFLTNSGFSGIQTAQLQQIRKPTPKGNLVDLERKISSSRSALEATKTRKSDLEQMIIEHHQLLAPFRRFPDDILREIFVFCLRVDHNAVMDTSEAPLLLGRICSRWRTLAYSTPRLWNTLHLCTFNPPRVDMTGTFWLPFNTHQKIISDFKNLFQLHYGAVQEWIDRSGVLPLWLSIDFRRSVMRDFRSQHFLPLCLDILLACCHRWKSLEITISSDICDVFLPALQFLSFPRLEYIHILFSIGDRPGRQWHLWNDSNILNAKRLHALRLSNYPLSPSSLKVDWSRLTQIILFPTPTARLPGPSGVTLEEAFEILRSCNKLQHCTLAVADTRTESNLSGVLSLPMLDSLTIIDGAFLLESLIRCFDFPSLRDITYYTTYPPLTSRRSPLISLLSITNGRVESLTTSLHFFTAQDLLDCFILLPSLSTLTTSWPTDWGDVTSKQTEWEREFRVPFAHRVMKSILFLLLPNSTNLTTGCLCPKLRTLCLTDSRNLSEQDAFDFIQQRLDASAVPEYGVNRLSKVQITFTKYSNAVGSDIPTRLQPFIDEGLNLVFKYPPPKILHTKPRSFEPRRGLFKIRPPMEILPEYRNLRS